MKFMVLNSSGNVGKSLFTRELLYPRLENCLIAEVETVNKSNKDFYGLNVWDFCANGESFDELYLKVLENENIVVDIGASRLGEFWQEMSKNAGFETLFDYFIIPTINTDKVMADTLKTITFLRNFGIQDDKIKVIFNQVEKTLEADFGLMLRFDFPFNRELFLRKAQLFTDLGILKKSISDIFNPDLDFYKEKILAEKDGREKIILVKSDLANRQAHKILNELDIMFTLITGISHDSFKNAINEPKIEKVSNVKAKPQITPKEPLKAVEDVLTSADDEEL